MQKIHCLYVIFGESALYCCVWWSAQVVKCQNSVHHKGTHSSTPDCRHGDVAAPLSKAKAVGVLVGEKHGTATSTVWFQLEAFIAYHRLLYPFTLLLVHPASQLLILFRVIFTNVLYLNFVSAELPQEAFGCAASSPIQIVLSWMDNMWMALQIMNFELKQSLEPSPYHADTRAELLLKRDSYTEELSIYPRAHADII